MPSRARLALDQREMNPDQHRRAGKKSARCRPHGFRADIAVNGVGITAVAPYTDGDIIEGQR